MSLPAVLGLVGLALVDSTSMGTLVLPVMLLLAARVDARRFLLYLATVAGSYALVGVVLVAAAGGLAGVARDLGDLAWLRRVELAAGAALFAVGVFGDPRTWFGRKRPHTDSDNAPATRATRWRERLTGPETSYRVVVGVGLGAALVEVASMLPFLAAVGIITAADLPLVGWVPVVLGYSVVMVLPALVLLGARQALDERLREPLERFSGWLDRHTGNAMLWVLALAGFLLVCDAYGAISA